MPNSQSEKPIMGIIWQFYTNSLCENPALGITWERMYQDWDFGGILSQEEMANFKNWG